jgi:hypothetical protein
MQEESPTIGMAETWTRKYQYLLDKSSPLVLYRWIGFAVVFALYFLRQYYLNGWFIVTYGLGIYLLNQLIGFLSPQFDPEESNIDLDLPTRESEEFRPFARRLPEFKFWYSCAKAVCIAIMMTFFEVFNIPVFWPILLLYFIVLFFITMKRQIMHMIKYKYVPFSFGKTTYSSAGKPVTKDAK